MNEVAEQLSTEVLRQLVEEIQDSPTVDYSSRNGGVCLICGTKRCRVTTTSPWCGSVRERFHKCRSCGLRFKSVEVE
ncbi:MAG: hypothetical protein JEY79_05505 [Pseudodesulfovibrio sp.]|nr:hypothetical protein [Pseudodesulfovibrio sp.]